MKQMHVAQNYFHNQPVSNPNPNAAFGFFWVPAKQMFPIQLLSTISIT